MRNSKLEVLLSRLRDESQDQAQEADVVNLSDMLASRVMGGDPPGENTGCINSSCYNSSCGQTTNPKNNGCTNNSCSTAGMENTGCTNISCINT